ncbi:MAG: VWA domain-containing protein [archaeon]
MVFRYGAYALENPEMLLLFIPLVLIMFIFFKIRIFRRSEVIKKSKALKGFIFFTNLLIIGALCIALSVPIIEEPITNDGVLGIKVIIDNTSSMQIYDEGEITQVINDLRKTGSLMDISYINTKESSDLGDEILKKLEPGKPILFITDGNSNSGTSLSDIGLLASGLNSKIFGLDLKPNKKDFSVAIDGPSKVISNVDSSFDIIVNKIGTEGKAQLKVYADDTVVYDDATDAGTLRLNFSFSEGEHSIVAVIDEEDYFKKNNIYYHSVYVIKKPKILIVEKTRSKLTDMLARIYDITSFTSVPEQLDDYYAVILHDIPAISISSKQMDILTDYLNNENGLFVVGGKNSLDFGDYNASEISQVIPVGIGTPKKKKDVVNIVIALDTGVYGAGIINTTGSSSGVTFFDVEKALAAEVIKSISLSSKVAVIESNSNPTIVSKLSELGPKRDELIDTISKLKVHDVTRITDSILVAQKMLRLERGSKNLILLTDGQPSRDYTTGEINRNTITSRQILKNVESLFSDGVKVFVVGVGQEADPVFLNQIAEAGGGRYFQTDQTNKLNIFFGDQNEIATDKLTVFIYDTNHFITKESTPEARVLGFNSIYQKDSAQLLATTTAGDPLLVIGRYGLSRVAVLGTDPEIWSPELLKKEYSALITRTVGWAVEDPERKERTIILSSDLIANESSEIIVKSELMPQSPELSFTETKKGVFSAFYFPTITGNVKLLNRTFSVNYNSEYSELGMNKKFLDMASVSGGKMLENDPSVIFDEIKSSTNSETIKTTGLSFVFVVFSIVLYLLQAIFRKVYEIKLARSL